MKLPWKTKGIVLTAPLTEEVDNVVKFIDEYLAPNGCNMIAMQIRYRYQFKKHPECMGYDPLSYEDVKKIVAVCKKNGIRLIPKMNLHGHQSGLPNTPTDGILHGHHEKINDIRDGLLRAYPDLDEQPNEPAYYSRSICLTNPLVKIILFDLIDELLEVFEADAMHIGCDEVLNIGLCPECRKYSNAKLFGDWITAVHDHLASRGARMLLWGDRFLSSAETGYQEYESSANGTDPAIDTVPKDILVCDWHYEVQPGGYPSVEKYHEKGFEMLISPWRVRENTDNFIKYAVEHDKGHIAGILLTTWCGSGDLARHMLYGESGRWLHTEEIGRMVRHIFEEE